MPSAPLRKLNDSHRLFVASYAGIGTGTEAAILAGFSPKRAAITATELLKDPLILRALRDKNGASWKKGIATVEEVQSRLTSVIRNNEAASKDIVAAADKLLKSFGTYSQTINQNIMLPENSEEAVKTARELL